MNANPRHREQVKPSLPVSNVNGMNEVRKTFKPKLSLSFNSVAVPMLIRERKKTRKQMKMQGDSAVCIQRKDASNSLARAMYNMRVSTSLTRRARST